MGIEDFVCQEAESFILSGMMQGEEMLCEGVESLSLNDFTSLESKTIFSSLSEIYTNQIKPSLENLFICLRKSGQMELCGGVKGVLDLCNKFTNLHDFVFYVEQVREKPK